MRRQDVIDAMKNGSRLCEEVWGGSHFKLAVNEKHWPTVRADTVNYLIRHRLVVFCDKYSRYQLVRYYCWKSRVRNAFCIWNHSNYRLGSGHI